MTTYLIAGALFILIIALIVVFRTPKKKKTIEVPEQEVFASEETDNLLAADRESEEDAGDEVSVTAEQEAGEPSFAEESEEAIPEIEIDEAGEGLETAEPEDTIADEEELDVEAESAGDEVSAEKVAGETEEKVVEPGAGLREEEVEASVQEVAAEEKPPAVTLEKYRAHLSDLEQKIRDELDRASKNNERVKKTLLEPKLQIICEMQAAAEHNFNRIKELMTEIIAVLELVHEALPGFDPAAVRQLQRGEFEVVEAMLSEASSQLDEDSELAAEVYCARGRLAEESMEYFSAYENYRKAYAADTENKNYLLAAGRMARMTGNDQDAQFWLEKMVRIGIETAEKTHEQSIAQHELGLVCVRTDQKEKGGALFKRAIEIKEQVLGTDHYELGPVMYDYGILFEGNGMYEQAEKLYTRSIEVTENKFGGKYPGLGSTLNRLAGVYEEMELADKAEPLYIRALAIKEKVLGKEHIDVGTILNHLAELLRRQGRHEEAEPLFLRSLAISEKELGPEHPNLTIVLNNLAELYSAMGREDEAANYQERAFSLFDLPGAGDDFVEIEKDEDFDLEEDKDQSVT